MTVIGVGVDIVDVSRFESALQRTPALLDRLFGPLERERDLAPHSLAARFAAKEAVVKSLGGHIPEFSWRDIQVSGKPQQQPVLTLSGGVERASKNRGITHHHLSLSHDAGMAIAFVVMEAQP